MKISIILSEYYPNISKMLLKGAINTLKKNKEVSYKIFKIKGTLEIPVVISKIITKYDAIIALGCVIKGKTKNFDLICSSVTQSIMELSIKYKKPIGNGILTCFNQKQAINRANYKKNDKGGEAVNAVLSVLKTFNNG